MEPVTNMTDAKDYSIVGTVDRVEMVRQLRQQMLPL